MAKAPDTEQIELQETDAETTTPSSPKKRPVLLFVLVLVLGCGGWFGMRYWQYATHHVSTDDAALSTDIIQIAPQVSGTVKQVLVRDNQMVKAGDALVVLDDATYQAAVDQAQANLDAAIASAKGAGVSVALTEETGNAQVMQAQGTVGQADSGIGSANADLARATAGVENARAVASGANANIATAQAALSAAMANKQRALSQVASAAAAVETARANVNAVQANVTAAATATENAQRDAQRYNELFTKGAISSQAVDHANAALKTAQAQEDAARRQVDAAQAVVSARQADLASARQQVDAADAAISQAKAQLAASREQAKAAHTTIDQAEAQRNSAQQAIRQAQARKEQAVGQLTQAKTAPRQVEVSKSAQAQALAKIEQARAALNTATIQLRYTRILAPVSGQISKKSVEAGALVQVGTPLMALVPQETVWVTANFKETQLENMRSANRAVITVDAFPKRHFLGRVESVSAATGSTFALLPPDNATGNFTKVVQRIPVKILLDEGQPDLDRLRAGMSVTATVETR